MTATVIMNEEFLVNIRHQRILITSLPFVHTARRCYRLNGLVRCKEEYICIPNYPKLRHLEEAKVVTRYL